VPCCQTYTPTDCDFSHWEGTYRLAIFTDSRKIILTQASTYRSQQAPKMKLKKKGKKKKRITIQKLSLKKLHCNIVLLGGNHLFFELISRKSLF